MAGKFRRKFITIISDRFTEHYQGKVPEKDLEEALKELAVLVTRLDNTVKNSKKQLTETLRKLKRLPMERLKEILSVLHAEFETLFHVLSTPSSF